MVIALSYLMFPVFYPQIKLALIRLPAIYCNRDINGLPFWLANCGWMPPTTVLVATGRHSSTMIFALMKVISR
ncbi:lacI-family regulatory protein [Yersinia pseudotuberculosis]|nr:lacI-family regulatory protein [Yersinia pseudotuberculosis]